MARSAYRFALPSFVLVAACFNPDDDADDMPSTMTASTIGSDTSSSGTVPTTDEDDASDEVDPTTADSSSGADDSGGSTTGDCTF